MNSQKETGSRPVGRAKKGEAMVCSELQERLQEMSDENQRTLAELLRQQDSGPRGSEAWALIHSLLKADSEMVETLSSLDAGTAVAPPMVKSFGSSRTVALTSELVDLEMDLLTAIARRYSSHSYGPGPLGLGALSTLLHHSYGVKKFQRAYNTRRFPFRFAPSAGGLQPVDLYVVANEVEDLGRGLYYYDPVEASLKVLDEGNMRRRLTRCSIAQDWLAYAHAVFVMVCNMDRVLWKYGRRGYRFAHVDAGVLAQNLYLVGTGLGLTTCAVAAFFDDAVHDLVGIDGHREFAVLMFAVGNKPDELGGKKSS